MAILQGPLQLTGRIGNLSYYKVGHEIHVRSFDAAFLRRRVKKDQRYKLFRAYAELMGRSSKIGSKVYKALPTDFREYWMYQAFVGEAMKMFRMTEMKDDEILAVLWRTYVEVWELKKMHATENSCDAKEKGGQEIVHKVQKRSKAMVRIRWKINSGHVAASCEGRELLISDA